MKWFFAITLLAALAAGAWLYRDRLPLGDFLQAQQPAATEVVRPQPTDADDTTTIQGIGYVEPVSEVRRLAFQADGVIAECRAEIGKRYAKGDVLVSLANQEETVAVTVAERKLQVARADEAKTNRGVHQERIDAAQQRIAGLRERLTFFEFDHKRNQSLSERSSVSEQDLQRSRRDLYETKAALAEAEADAAYLKAFVLPEDRALAAAQVQLAESELSLARARLAETIIHAPFDGEVLEVLQREGERIGAIDHKPVVLFADLSKVRIRAEIDERHVRLLRAGQSVRIFGRNLQGATYDARISTIKPLMGDKSVFTRSSTERKDLDVIQVFVEVPPDFHAPTGLRVDVAVDSHHD